MSTRQNTAERRDGECVGERLKLDAALHFVQAFHVARRVVPRLRLTAALSCLEDESVKKDLAPGDTLNRQSAERQGNRGDGA